MKTGTIKPNKKRALKILAIFKEMAEEKGRILDHLESGGKFSDIKLNRKRLAKPV